jgi:hypothetical protein
MYKGFNLSVTNDFFEQSHRGIGEYLHATNKRAIKESLDSFLGATGKVDAGKLQEHWFPQIKADVFISHSHRDRDVAMMLAGWLSTSFGLKPFIDSCVWGYANDLLREIDDKYCRLPIEGLWYDYLRCNGTSAHVHMMLAAALHTMIDSTECLIFLNTPNSISSEEAASTTASPWIYMEIMMTRFIRTQLRRERLVAKGTRQFAAKMEPEFVYPATLDHLISIDHAKLKEWLSFFGRNTIYHPLDYLYMFNGGA